MKTHIKKTLNKLGYDLKRIDPETFKFSFDKLLKDNISQNPIIFDVGANKGQSIEKYLEIFTNPIIHSFEPIKSDFEIMKEKFEGNKNVYLNNFALGEREEEKEFNITVKTGNSSFNKINLGTKWLKTRSKEHNTSEHGYTALVEKVAIKRLDDYCKDNKISHIDLLKIDTQGYEDKVLEGSMDMIRNNKIKTIKTEIMFDDVYDKYFSFSDLEKFLIPNNFRMVAIDLANNNLFTGLVFFADVYYFNRNFYSI